MPIRRPVNFRAETQNLAEIGSGVCGAPNYSIEASGRDSTILLRGFRPVERAQRKQLGRMNAECLGDPE